MLIYFLLGAIGGYIYCVGSTIVINEVVLYLGLSFSLILLFLKWRITHSEIILFCFIIFFSVFQWVLSLILGVNLDMLVWKISLGMMWLLVALLMISQLNQSTLKKFIFVLFGFGVSFCLIALYQISHQVNSRLSFIGDGRAPHVYASAMILTGASLVSTASLTIGYKRLVFLIMGWTLVIVSLLTLSKTSVIALFLFIIYTVRSHLRFSSIAIIIVSIYSLLFGVYILDADFTRSLDFRFANASIGGRFELFEETLVSSMSNFGLPGFVGYPKYWIDTSIGSLISIFGVVGTTLVLVLMFSKVQKVTFPIIIISFLFLTTEHFALPRILFPFLILIICDQFIHKKTARRGVQNNVGVHN